MLIGMSGILLRRSGALGSGSVVFLDRVSHLAWAVLVARSLRAERHV
jgi:hypothetical protein